MHAGPFANIAHGCNSVIATNTAMNLSDIAVTKLGLVPIWVLKFLDIKCRALGTNPDVVVIVATVRAMYRHSGSDEKTIDNLKKRLLNLKGILQKISRKFIELNVVPFVSMNLRMTGLEEYELSK